MGVFYANSNSNSGRIIQIVGNQYTTSMTSSSTSYVDTGLTQTITTKRAGSKIICIVTQPFDCSANGLYARVRFRVYRQITGGSTGTFDGGGECEGIYIGAHTSSQHIRQYGTYTNMIFDPTGYINSGVNVNYKVQVHVDSASSPDVRINYNGRHAHIQVVEMAQ